ncbi:MAG: PEP-CTERM sorting domain-containing protein [Pirellulales bacterium]
MNRIDRPVASSSYRGRVVLAAMLAVAMTGLSTSALQAAILPRSVLKSYFQSGDKPTQSQFRDMIDSALNMTDDGLTVALPVDATGAVRFEDSALIGPVLSFADLSLVPGLSDDWLGSAGYLPLEINQAGQTHYGYLQMHSGAPGSTNPYAVTVEYYVFNDQPDMPLAATAVPEPSTIALSIGGALGLWAIARRRRA